MAAQPIIIIILISNFYWRVLKVNNSGRGAVIIFICKYGSVIGHWLHFSQLLLQQMLQEHPELSDDSALVIIYSFAAIVR